MSAIDGTFPLWAVPAAITAAWLIFGTVVKRRGAVRALADGILFEYKRDAGAVIVYATLAGSSLTAWIMWGLTWL